MEIIRGRRFGKSVQIQEVSTSPFDLLPPSPDVCQECAAAHPPECPHNKQSLYYQMQFHLKHGRTASWADAMAHCPDEIKALTRSYLLNRGVEVDR